MSLLFEYLCTIKTNSLDQHNQNLLSQLLKVERLAVSSKWSRLIHDPFKYLFAIFYRRFIYPGSRKEVNKKAKLFFGSEMNIALPAATDIYLTGGKTHDSELRLARFLLHYLNRNDHFLDVGAHFGYFSMLASTIVGPGGKVVAFEAASKNFSILQSNASANRFSALHEAVSDKMGNLTFYEFPNLYSEYNTMEITQFENEPWFKEYKPTEVRVRALTIEDIIKQYDIHPHIIKIDVEGAEYKVIRGATQYFTYHNPYFVMEYLAESRSNEAHQKAVKLMRSLDYTTFIIAQDGVLEEVEDIDSLMMINNLDSENVVFKKIDRLTD